MLSNKFKSVLCISFLFFSFSAAATNQAQETASKKSESSVEVIEVRGDNSLLMLRAQTRARQRAFYNELNSMLEDELFHVTCENKRIEARTGSHVVRKQWQCVPNFAQAIEDEINFGTDEGLLGQINNTLRAQEFKKRYAEKEKEMMLLVKQAIEDSPELSEKYESFMQAKENYKTKHYEAYGALSKHAKDVAQQPASN